MKYEIELHSPDHWKPTEKQIEIFINAGIAHSIAEGAGIYRYTLNVKNITKES